MSQFDAIKSMNELIDTDVTKKTAEAIIRVIQSACNDSVNEEIIATKKDIYLLRDDINKFKIEVKNDINEFKIEVKNDIYVLREDINKLEIKLLNRMNDIVWKIIGSMSVIMGLLVTFQHFIK